MRSLVLAALVATAASCADTPTDDLDGVSELDPGGPARQGRLRRRRVAAGRRRLQRDRRRGPSRTSGKTPRPPTRSSPASRGARTAASTGTRSTPRGSARSSRSTSVDSWFKTVTISTPFGKSGRRAPSSTAPTSRSCCASRSRPGTTCRSTSSATTATRRCYFGHFGVRTATGQWSHARGLRAVQGLLERDARAVRRDVAAGHRAPHARHLGGRRAAVPRSERARWARSSTRSTSTSAPRA